MNTESEVKSKKKIPDDSSNPDADTSPPASVMKSGGVLGRKVGKNVHHQLRKHVIKSLNMMGNDPQRTGYVVSNHLLTPGLF